MLNTPVTYALRALSIFYPVQKPLVFSGSGTMFKLIDLLLGSGQKKPLLVTDRFLLANNKLDALLEHLYTHNCEVTIFDGSIPNLTITEVETGLKLSINNNCDSVVAIGGGSVIDVAKVIAAASTNNIPLNKLAGILKVKESPLPFYVVPTTSGTGSEVTNAAVISDSTTHKKRFFIDPKYVPIAAALDPELLKSLPADMTAAVGMDALTHAIEAYTSRNNFSDSDRDAEIAIKLLFDYLPIAYADGDNIKAREMVAQASFLAGYAFSKSSLGYVHAISHQVSAHYNTPHGLANAIILPLVLRFNSKVCEKRFAKLEATLSGSFSTETKILAERFTLRVDQLAKQIGIPSNLPELKEEDFQNIAKNAIAEAWRSYAVPKVMRKKDIEMILRSIYVEDKNVSFI